MKQIENKYVLKRITSAQDSIYFEAIKIYNETTPPDIKTNTNEIMYWLNKNDSNSNFEVMVFALVIDDKIVGFSMMSYLKQSKIIVIEYLALIEAYRVNVVFFSFMNLMKNYLSATNYDVRYFVVEISNKNNGRSVDKESQFFLKFLCLEGYGRANASYFTLPLGMLEMESSFNAHLYIKSNDHLTELTKDTYMSIIREIYYKYFYNWYKPTMSTETASAYKRKADDYFDTIENNMQKKETVEIVYNTCSTIELEYDVNTSGAIPSQVKIKKALVIPFLICLITILPVMFALIYSYVLPRVGMELNEVSSMIGTIFTSILTVTVSLLYYSKKKS